MYRSISSYDKNLSKGVEAQTLYVRNGINIISLVNKSIEQAKAFCDSEHSAMKCSQLNREEDNGEQVIRETKGFLVYPAGNRSIPVDINLTDATIKIENKYAEDEIFGEGESSCNNSEPSDSQRTGGLSLSRLVQEKKCIKYLNIPLGLVESIAPIELESFKRVILIKTKDYRSVALYLTPLDDQDNLMYEMIKLAFPGEANEDHFVLNYTYKHSKYFRKELESPAKLEAKKIIDDPEIFTRMNQKHIDRILKDTPLDENGWDVYNFDEEFKRQEITDKFRIAQCWTKEKVTSATIAGLISMLSSNNEDTQKQYFHTYPQRVYVPSSISDEDLARCAIFRSRNRFPALSFYFKLKDTSLWRCSQNNVGVFGKRSSYDEKMLECIGGTNSHTEKVVIVDARSKMSAQANRLKGGGFEYEEYYTNCTMYFGGIDNIHGVRNAYSM